MLLKKLMGVRVKMEEERKAILIIRRIDEVCDLDIDSYYKTIIIKKLINNWREED